MPKRGFLVAGGVLMILVGLARGAGGLALLARGADVDPNIRAGGAAVTAVAALLLAVGLVLIVAGVGVLRSSRPFRLVGIAAAVLFVIDGMINGYVLYGRPGDRGTMVNAIAAALIVACLVLGRETAPGRGGPHVQR